MGKAAPHGYLESSIYFVTALKFEESDWQGTSRPHPVFLFLAGNLYRFRAFEIVFLDSQTKFIRIQKLHIAAPYKSKESKNS